MTDKLFLMNLNVQIMFPVQANTQMQVHLTQSLTKTRQSEQEDLADFTNAGGHLFPLSNVLKVDTKY